MEQLPPKNLHICFANAIFCNIYSEVHQWHVITKRWKKKESQKVCTHAVSFWTFVFSRMMYHKDQFSNFTELNIRVALQIYKPFDGGENLSNIVSVYFLSDKTNQISILDKEIFHHNNQWNYLKDIQRHWKKNHYFFFITHWNNTVGENLP